MSAGDGEQPRRTVCERCARPPRACYCSALPTHELQTAVTRVLVLQYEREQRRRQAISSVPVLRLVLKRDVDVLRVTKDCECGVGADARLDELLYSGEGSDAALVLFPDAQAKLLDGELLCELGLVDGSEQQTPSAVDALGAGSKATRGRVLLVVIDGTWTDAKKIAFRNRGHWAKAAESWRRRGKRFEYVCLAVGDASTTDGAASPPSSPLRSGKSIYGDLRREPMDGCVSTLEAVAGALRVLEPPATGESVSNALLSAFRGMVAVQSAFQQRGKTETLRRYGGVSKEAAIKAKKLNDQPASAIATNASAPMQASSPLLRREYVFYSTRTDFRQRQELVQQGDPITYTYDQARDKCSELNVGRKRGQRLAFLPLDVFQQRRRDQGERSDAD